MSETADPHHVSQVARHGLGPHVVGQRVVVRRVVRGVTGPTGGPALTDLLGVCLSWADGVCVVQPEDGPAVAIALTDIVSGKPVPPRPSTRLRVSAAEAQRRADALIRDLHTEPLDGWLLRHSPTSAAPRANSVLAFGPCGIDDAPERVTAFYAERTRRPLAAVLPGTAEEALLRARGWTRGRRADTLFQLAGVARALRLLRGHPAGAAECEYDGEGDRVTVRIGDHAHGAAVCAEDWVGLAELRVHPEHRRRGLGLAALGALLDWGAERGATTAYLQVLADDVAAIGLGERVGFATHHAVRYLAAP